MALTSPTVYPILPCRNLSISTNWRCTILTGLTKGLSRVASAYRSSSQFGTHPNSSYRTEKFSSRPTKSLSMVKHLIKCWLMPITKPKTVPCTGFRSTGAIAPFQDKRNSIHKAGR
ncbi:Uncharacterised protein [Vibrio cholerae]|nr:Uncharacterised protein [Vibrio cholerae]CSD02864.1 Uncharacterised protein [Vibrio cholerae]CSI40222.1 Uncharacterised protein [Vibrio cholerae]CSI77926.1 Uncharacterised protein [Vibrio cholerae]